MESPSRQQASAQASPPGTRTPLSAVAGGGEGERNALNAALPPVSGAPAAAAQPNADAPLPSPVASLQEIDAPLPSGSAAVASDHAAGSESFGAAAQQPAPEASAASQRPADEGSRQQGKVGGVEGGAEDVKEGGQRGGSQITPSKGAVAPSTGAAVSIQKHARGLFARRESGKLAMAGSARAGAEPALPGASEPTKEKAPKGALSTDIASKQIASKEIASKEAGDSRETAPTTTIPSIEGAASKEAAVEEAAASERARLPDGASAAALLAAVTPASHELVASTPPKERATMEKTAAGASLSNSSTGSKRAPLSPKGPSLLDRAGRGLSYLTTKLRRSPIEAASYLGQQLVDSSGASSAAVLVRDMMSGKKAFGSIVRLSAGMAATTDAAKRKAYVSVLRTSMDLLSGLLQAATQSARVHKQLRKRINDQLCAWHLHGGVRLAEHGALKHYTLEVLRLNRTESQAMRTVTIRRRRMRAGTPSTTLYQVVRKGPCDAVRTRGVALCHRRSLLGPSPPTGSCEPRASATTTHCTAARPVCSGSERAVFPCEESIDHEVIRPAEVLERGFIRSLSLHVRSQLASGANGSAPEPSIGQRSNGLAGSAVASTSASAKPAAGSGAGARASPASRSRFSTKRSSADGSGAAHHPPPSKASALRAGRTAADAAVASGVGGAGADPLAQVHAHLDGRFKCFGGAVRACLPLWMKASLPFDLPDEWMPPSLRDRADEVLTFDLALDLELTFDAPDAAPAASGRGPPSPAAESPVRFQLQLTGNGCFPTLGQLTLRSVKVRANCKLWWDIFEQRLLLAFVTDTANASPPELTWDSEVSLLHCGLGVPDAIEDGLVNRMVSLVMASHSRLNPLEIRLTQIARDADEESAASSIQARFRGRKGRDRVEDVRRAVSGGEKLQKQVAAMEREIRALKAEVERMRGQR